MLLTSDFFSDFCYKKFFFTQPSEQLSEEEEEQEEKEVEEEEVEEEKGDTLI